MFNNTSYIVYDGGDYNESDLVQVCHVGNQELPIASYQAYYIINGYDYLSEVISPKEFKIGYEDPIIIDYDIMGFHKKRTIIFGELRKIEYYKSYENDVYSDIVVDETRDYIRDDNGLVQYRNLVSRWYLSDETVGKTKSSTKYYSLTESIQEGIERRSNVISLTKSYVLVNLGQLYSFDLLSSVKNEIQLFLDGYTQPLRDAITSSSKPYLNQNTKNGIIENLRLS